MTIDELPIEALLSAAGVLWLVLGLVRLHEHRQRNAGHDVDVCVGRLVVMPQGADDRRADDDVQHDEEHDRADDRAKDGEHYTERVHARSVALNRGGAA